MLMLIFYVGKERYACDCEHIIEVLPKVQLKPVPHAPPYVSGLLNLGGYPIPVIDLCWLMENRHSEDCMHTRIIMMNYTLESGEAKQLGMLAEKVTETRDLDLNLFHDSGMKIEELNYINGVMNDSEGMIRLLVVETLFETMKETIFKTGEELQS